MFGEFVTTNALALGAFSALLCSPVGAEVLVADDVEPFLGLYRYICHGEALGQSGLRLERQEDAL